MSIYKEASETVIAIRKECDGMAQGAIPSPLLLREYHSKLVEIHMRLVEDTADHYRSSLVTKLKRMTFMGQRYKGMRIGGSMTAKDAEMHYKLGMQELKRIDVGEWDDTARVYQSNDSETYKCHFC